MSDEYQQQTYQALKQILPELQTKLRHNIQLEFQQELQKAQMFYQKYAQDMLLKKQKEMKEQMQRNQSQLRRQLGMIQRERQQWLLLEQNYRKAIVQLTQKLKQAKDQSNISALTEIKYQNQITQEDKPEPVAVWKKRKEQNQNLNQTCIKGNKNLSVQVENLASFSKYSKEGQSISSQNQDENLLEERPLMAHQETNSKMCKISRRSSITRSEMGQRGKRQDTMVLSPPKTQDVQYMKTSLLQPPSNPTSKVNIFWNEQGKKKLLTMIRGIK